MSLYRRHQRLQKFEEWSNAARFSFPVGLIMEITGCDAVTKTDGHGWWMVIGSAAVSVIGWWAHKKAAAALSKFVAELEASKDLRARYEQDAKIGRHQDLIASLQAEQTAALMLAANEAKHGRAWSAGFFYGQAKVAESRLRHHNH